MLPESTKLFSKNVGNIKTTTIGFQKGYEEALGEGVFRSSERPVMLLQRGPLWNRSTENVIFFRAKEDLVMEKYLYENVHAFHRN